MGWVERSLGDHRRRRQPGRHGFRNGRARWAERVRKRGFLSGRRRGGVVRKGGRVVVAVRHDVWWWSKLTHHTTSRLCSSRVRLERTIAAEPHAVHRPGNPGGGGSFRFSRRSLQKLRCAFGKTRNYRLNPPLTFGSVDLGEQQEEERSLSSSERRSGCPRKNRVQDTAEEHR